jgi:hypothetical protein
MNYIPGLAFENIRFAIQYVVRPMSTPYVGMLKSRSAILPVVESSNLNYYPIYASHLPIFALLCRGVALLRLYLRSQQNETTAR